MQRLIPTLLPLLMGCVSHNIGTEPMAVGSQLEGTPQPGSAISIELTSIDGEAIGVPDPRGRAVVLELIRSAEW